MIIELRYVLCNVAYIIYIYYIIYVYMQRTFVNENFVRRHPVYGISIIIERFVSTEHR